MSTAFSAAAALATETWSFCAKVAAIQDEWIGLSAPCIGNQEPTQQSLEEARALMETASTTKHTSQHSIQSGRVEKRDNLTRAFSDHLDDSGHDLQWLDATARASMAFQLSGRCLTSSSTSSHDPKEVAFKVETHAENGRLHVHYRQVDDAHPTTMFSHNFEPDRASVEG